VREQIRPIDLNDQRGYLGAVRSIKQVSSL
jgi:hypothetical protein